MPGIRWIIPFEIIVLPHSIQLLKLFCYPTDLSLNVNKMIIAYNSSKMFHPQELWWNVLWHDGLKAAFDVQMSGTISFPVPEGKYTNTGTKDVTRHINQCANGPAQGLVMVRKSHHARAWCWFGNCGWQHHPVPLMWRFPDLPAPAPAIPTYWSKQSFCKWTFMNSLVHQHSSFLANGSYRKQFDETSQIWRQKIPKSGRFNWIFLLHIFGTFIIPPPHPPGI